MRFRTKPSPHPLALSQGDRPSTRNGKQRSPSLWHWAGAPLMLLSSLWLGAPVAIAQDDSNRLTYSQFLQEIDNGQVKEVIIDTRTQTAKVVLAGQDENTAPKQVKLFARQTEAHQALIDNLLDSGIALEIESSADRSFLVGIFAQGLILVVIIGGLILIVRKSAKASGQALNFGKSRARFHVESQTGVTFGDVAGIDEAKEELQEVVTFLKDTERFTAVGARIPKGVLLVGAPGTGKTLLAKAVAGEAGVPFFSISGSEFVEMFVGVGASRVRDLFKRAKENAPCLIFIDEIDAVGRRRGIGIGGGNDEREQTLNQLLTELDGFEGNTGVIAIAATNRPDVLDRALLRPGRFDRQVVVDLPGYNGRLGILQVHARNKKLSPEVSLEVLARRTPGLSGAELSNVLNEAAILTARRFKPAITPIEIDDALDRVTIGLTLNPLLDSKKKRIIAYHEVGHGLLRTLLEHADPLNKITIIPRSGGTLGFSQALPDEETIDTGLVTRAWLLDRITITLGGRAVEEEVLGANEVTQGAYSDLQAVTGLAREMVTRYGMSELGLVALEEENNRNYAGVDPVRGDYSQDVAAEIDDQVRAIAQRCYEKARRLIRKHRSLVDRLAEILVYEETIEGDRFRAIVAEETVLPKKQLLPVAR